MVYRSLVSVTYEVLIHLLLIEILSDLQCYRFAQTDKYMNVDVDIGSSMVATAVVQLAVGYVTTLTVDLAFLLEGQAEDELPERLLGSIRLHNLALDAAITVPVLDYSRRVAFAVAGVFLLFSAMHNEGDRWKQGHNRTWIMSNIHVLLLWRN